MYVICRRSKMAPPDAFHAHATPAWFRQPVLWLGVAVFLASMAGCVWLIVVGASHHDTPLKTTHTVFGVPTEAASTAPAPASPQP